MTDQDLGGRRALVTGGASGIGLACVRELTARGAHVTVADVDAELARAAANEVGGTAWVVDLNETHGLDSLTLDIDILINNAGFGISGAVEFTKTEDAKRLFDTNFFGMVNMNRAVVPVMREAGQGRIVNISSVAGQIPIPFQTYYSAAKAATNSYTMALANELRPYGVTVCAVQPGDIKTGFTKAREKTVDGDDVYGGRIGRSVSRMEHDEQTGMDPAVAGKFIANVAMKKKVSPIYTIGASYSFLTFLTRLMSWKTMNKIIGAIYAK